jgi:ABC-type cobalamin/Fe3+-siderophores transport system ATPase subunit
MMYLKQLTISNYKSFYEPKTFNFEPGFNVLLGANSSGKTSVLEAICFHGLANTPHRSVLNVLDIDSVPSDTPTVQLRFSVDIKEVTKLAQPSNAIHISLGHSNGQFYSADLNLLSQRVKNELLHLDLMTNQSTGQHLNLSFEGWDTPWRVWSGSNSFPGLQIDRSSCMPVEVANIVGDASDLRPCWERIKNKIYKFSAERSVQSASGPHGNSELQSNSSNLAFCINHLQSSNKDLFEELNRLLSRVFPTIHWVAAPSDGNGIFELKVHTTPTKMNRGDLAVPINRVGTGVGNALAMLYVALTAQTQRFILLEEPNSFLHPRALRELLAILSEIGSKHQFFITTHSSDVLRTLNSSTVTLLEHDGIQTSVKQTMGSKLHELKSGLIDLGIRLTDLHGCDEVLWVEGETEEAVFPMLLRHYFPEKAQGIAVLPVVSTGEFDSKKLGPKKIADIYKRLSESSFLAPPMVAIALDKERRSDQEMKQVKRECGRLVNFLPRTMLEDYFLDAEALTFVINQYAGQEINIEEAQASLKKAAANVKNALNPKNPQSSDVHAAKALNSVFQELLKSEYKKVSHGLDIATWLLKNKPNHFDELKVWFSKFI